MKKLTKTGEEFIKTICSGNSNSLLKGKYKYNLPFSISSNSSVTYESIIKDHIGGNVSNNTQLGEELIYLFNKYGEINGIDSNLLAAQAYADSGYRTWHYNQFDSGSGIVNLQSIRVFTNIVKSAQPETFEGLNNISFEDWEISLITNGLTNPLDEISYLYRGSKINNESLIIAERNKTQLHQNVINNLDIVIRAQANIMSEILTRNNGIVANALFAYATYWMLVGKSYPDMVDTVGREYGDNMIKKGTDYANLVFRILGDKNNTEIKTKITKPVGIWFGYDIDFKIDRFTAYLA